nr:MAG TPA: hypothetical protein [Caudoviricetes sp.]
MAQKCLTMPECWLWCAEINSGGILYALFIYG